MGRKGFMTIEITLLIPILLIVVAFVITVFLFSIGESTERERITKTLYTESAWNKKEQRNLEQEGVVTITAIGLPEEGEYLFQSKTRVKREWNLCTKRLRRWQMYGDISDFQRDE